MYNRREIMTTAWTKHRRFGIPFAQALRLAWYEAKRDVARYTVIVVRIATGAENVLGDGLTFDQAANWNGSLNASTTLSA
ncbi:MAG: hypothetical protein SOV75_02345 [Candidatus Limiplasma sp.]|nr:hypothetical protein [Candidatus Limiplasma sp.]